MGEEQQRGSRVVRITSTIVTGSVALSIAVIIIALSIVSGFRQEIRERTTGFVGEVIISPFGTDYMNDAYPLSLTLSYLPMISDLNNVSHIQSFAFIHGLIQVEDAIQGVVIKGVGKEFDPAFFNATLSVGRFPQCNDTVPSMELLVSKRMSDALSLEISQTGDLSQKIVIWFIDESGRARPRSFTICGMHNATLEEMDRTLAIGDIRVVQQLNGWTPVQVGGIEVLLHHPGSMEQTAREIEELAARYGDGDDDSLSVKTAKDLFANLFDWLKLVDMNLLIVLILMIAVAGVNMVSGLLIMLFDKTSMIGLLKSLGMKNREIRLAFIFRMGKLILWGMFIGNVIALTLCMLQKQFTLISLDQSNYAVSSVPISINAWGVCLMNMVSFLLIMGLMVLASMMVMRISPERALRVS